MGANKQLAKETITNRKRGDSAREITTALNNKTLSLGRRSACQTGAVKWRWSYAKSLARKITPLF